MNDDNNEVIEDFNIFEDYVFNWETEITAEEWAQVEEMMKHIKVSFKLMPLDPVQLEKMVEERDDLTLEDGKLYLTQENRFYID